MIVDACAHPLLVDTEELRTYLPTPWNGRPIPVLEHTEYAPTEPRQSSEIGPDAAVRELLERRGIDHVVLVPPTRSRHPNIDLVSAICTATNEWLADTWLPVSDRFWGSIRINPADPLAALRELERWAEHPRFVQVAIPLQSQHPYGQRQFFQIWEAAARRGLPVAIHSDGGSGTDFAPTIVGPLQAAIEYATLQPLNVVYHLASFIAEGVFERLPDLRVVCAEGGLDALTPVFWRFDKDYRGTREEIPWTKQMPTNYLHNQVRFCTQAVDLPPEGVDLDAWFDLTAADRMMMYASNFPRWDRLEPTLELADESLKKRILGGSAMELYGLPVVTPTS